MTESPSEIDLKPQTPRITAMSESHQCIKCSHPFIIDQANPECLFCPECRAAHRRRLHDHALREDYKIAPFANPKPCLNTMQYTVQPVEKGWSVEAIDMDDEGRCFRAVFTGPQACVRATDYAAWMNRNVEPPRKLYPCPLPPH